LKITIKLYSSFAVAIMLSAVVLAPAANAETFTQKKDPIVTLLKQQHLGENTFTSKAVNDQIVVTQATYKQQIETNQIHGYLFRTNGGSFSVKTLHPQTDAIDFLVYNLDTEATMTVTSTGELTLPAGSYEFFVKSSSDQPIDYDYELDGPFSEQPDTNLPTIQVTSPTTYDTRMAKGSANTIAFSGSSTNADQLVLSSDNEEFNLASTGTFSQNVTLRNGMNSFSLSATSQSGNTVIFSYSITLPGISRLQGTDRYEVSSNISKELSSIGGNTSGTVVIARGDIFSDALSGGPLATSEDAPILLTSTKSLPDSVKAQIKNLAPEKAIILGGTGSVSTNVEAQLKSLGVTTIDRIAGKDRFEVAASVAERVSDSSQSDTAIIASGEVFPDALSASSIAGPMGMPVLLVQSDTVPNSIQTYIKNHPEVTNFIVVGGTATVKDTVVTKIKSLHSGATIDRISGMDRYEVSVNVAKYGLQHYGMDLSTIAIARGDLFPDALSGAPLANWNETPILLTSTKSLDDKINAFLTSHTGEMDHMYIFGGIGSISQNTENQLNNFIR
jgi:putative cell wall-binding protein